MRYLQSRVRVIAVVCLVVLMCAPLVAPTVAGEPLLKHCTITATEHETGGTSDDPVTNMSEKTDNLTERETFDATQEAGIMHEDTETTTTHEATTTDTESLRDEWSSGVYSQNRTHHIHTLEADAGDFIGVLMMDTTPQSWNGATGVSTILAESDSDPIVPTNNSTGSDGTSKATTDSFEIITILLTYLAALYLSGVAFYSR